MKDDGTISERGPLGRGSVDRLIGLKYLRSAILETRDIAKFSFSRIFIFKDKQKSVKTSKFLSLKNI